jgi:hypothetical protein
MVMITPVAMLVVLFTALLYESLFAATAESNDEDEEEVEVGKGSELIAPIADWDKL